MAGMTIHGGTKKGPGLGGGFHKLTAAQMTLIGTRAILVMRQRITSGINLAGGGAKPYSKRGPIYVPISGAGGQTKTSVRGREVITKPLMRAAKGAGTAKHAMGKSRSGRSMKFANYTAYKQYLGKGGQRDLEVSGAMLRAVKVVRASVNYCAIGFGSALQEAKARGNQRIDPWFGLAINDQKVVAAYTAQVYGQPISTSTAA